MTIENDQIINAEGWFDSSYKFTEPIRYFKSNDPYYWEVDNIPIKQLEENILWLKDQVSTNPLISGVNRSELSELQPYATGNARVVSVKPGRFTARINDAYKKGVNQLVHTAASLIEGQSSSDSFVLDVDILRRLVGDPSVLGAIYNNGLYDHLQHHNSEPVTGSYLEWRHGYSLVTKVIGNGITDANNLPKNKLAIWKNLTVPPVNEYDLQQLAVEWTRYWGGAVRTSIVNINEPLSIEVPEFDDEDFANKGAYQPAVRIDLLFIYAHPIDASSTTIPNPTGQLPTTITAPQLGLVKGAGVIGLSGAGAFGGVDINSLSYDWFNSNGYLSATDNPNSFMTLGDGDGVDDQGNYKISAPIVDLKQVESGIENTYGSFPSPDDLMNLAPLFQQQLDNEGAEMGLIGQTVLPVAYVISRRGKTAITSEDLIDIRPFFRTTELTYNERAGVAAANPPLSFANPAVGKKELQRSVLYTRNYADERITTAIQKLKTFPIATGMVLGGTRWGVEGALLGFAQNSNQLNGTSDENLLDALKQYGHLPQGTATLPELPGWDIAPWCDGEDAGTKRNDRIHSVVAVGGGSLKSFTGIPKVESLNNNLVLQTMLSNSNTPGEIAQLHYHNWAFVKKTITFANPDIFSQAGISDYDVQVSLANCAPMTSQPYSKYDEAAGPQNYIKFGSHVAGLTVEKHGQEGFTIYVWFSVPDIEQTFSNSNALTSNSRSRLPLSTDKAGRDASWFSSFTVMNKTYANQMTNINTFNRFATGNNDEQANISYGSAERINPIPYNNRQHIAPVVVTYPTVSFSVIGYSQQQQVFANTTGTVTNDNLTLYVPEL